MIVRNEEKNIADCLESVRELVDELVVVDTGSQDRTKVIASALGAKVFDFPWVDSFARARNEAILHATGDWIFWLDADDRLDRENREKLKKVFQTLPRKRLLAYSMKVECVAQPGGSATVVDHVRLFPRHSALRWEYRVHENILPSINRLGGKVEWAPVHIQHLGYLDASLRAKKHARDHALLLKNLDEWPGDPFIHFNLGHSLIEVGDLDGAAQHLRESISRSEPHYSQVKKAYALLSQVERNRGDLEGAMRVVQEGRAHHPENAELLFFGGLFLHELGRLEEAALHFRKILETPSWPQEFGSFDVGILGHKTKHQLARVYLDMKRLKDAEELLVDLRAARPDYRPVCLDLAQLFIERGRSHEAWSVIHDLRKGGLRTEALFLEAVLEEKAGRLEAAALAHEKVLEIDPAHEDSLRLMAQIHLKLKNDAKAEWYFRAAAERNPRSAQASHNLAIFLSSKGLLEEALQAAEKALSVRPRYGMSLGLRDEIRRRLKHNGGGILPNAKASLETEFLKRGETVKEHGD